jgi:hypothetical protein
MLEIAFKMSSLLAAIVVTPGKMLLDYPMSIPATAL